jgi:hypothetical protein
MPSRLHPPAAVRRRHTILDAATAFQRTPNDPHSVRCMELLADRHQQAWDINPGATRRASVASSTRYHDGNSVVTLPA